MKRTGWLNETDTRQTDMDMDMVYARTCIAQGAAFIACVLAGAIAGGILQLGIRACTITLSSASAL